MAITISGENNNDKILASDGVIDQISGINIVGVLTATSFTGDLTGDVTGNLTGNVTGNINNTTLLLQTGGTERLRITSAGRVGIGSDTPVAHLDVANYQNIEVLRLRDRHFNKYLTIRGGGSPNRMVIDSYEGGGGGAAIDLASNGDTKVRITADGKIGIGTHTPDHSLHVYKEGGDSVITIESTGNGNHSALEFMRTSSGGNSKGAGSIFVTGDTSASAAKMNFGVAYNIGHGTHSRMTIEGANGRVGIGTDSPTDILDVYSTTDPTIRSRSGSSSVGALMEICGGSSNDSTLVLSSGTTKKYQIFRDGSQSDDLRIYDTANTLDIMRYRHGGYLLFGVNGYEAFRIDSGRRLLHGVTSNTPVCSVAGAQLQVHNNASVITASFTGYGNHAGGSVIALGKSRSSTIGDATGAVSNGDTLGDIRFGGSDGTDMHNTAAAIRGEVDGSVSGNTLPGRLVFSTNSGSSNIERLRITSDGRFGFNTTNPDSNFTMDLAGSLRVGTGSYGSRIQFSRSGLGDELVIGVDGYGSNFSANDAVIQSSPSFGRPLIFGTNNQERLRINSNGDVTTTGQASFNRQNAGFTARAGDSVSITRASGTPLELNRTGSDGQMIALIDDNSIEASIGLSSGSLVIGLPNSNSERLRIDTNGNLKQGTSNPGPFTSTSPTSGLRFLGNKVMQGCVSSTTTLNGSGAGTFDFGKLWTTDDTSIELFIQVVRNDSGNYTTHYAKAFINKVRGSGMSQGHILYQNGAAQSNGFSITGISAGGYTGSGGSSHGTQITVTGGAGGVIYRATCFYTAISKNAQWS